MRPESLAGLPSIARRPARLLNELPEPVRAGRHVYMLDAQRAKRVTDRVDDRDRAGDGAGLADTLDAELICRRRCDRAAELETRKLVGRGHEVVDHRARLELPGIIVVNALFEERLRDTLGDSSVNLAVDDHRVDDVAAVVHGDISLKIDTSGFRIDLHA